MRIIYHPVNTDGSEYSAGSAPAVSVNKFGDPQQSWNGTAFTTDATPAQAMTAANAGDWTYDVPDAVFDTVSCYQVIAQATGGVPLGIVGSAAQLADIFQLDASATVYASAVDLAAYLQVDQSTLPTDSSRQLQRASELVDDVTLSRIDSTNPHHIAAARNATCAQVEFWMERGEDNDIGGPVQSTQIGSTQIFYGTGASRVSPTYLAPRAERFLRRAGLLNRGASVK